MIKFKHFLITLLIISLFIIPIVSAETLSGTLGSNVIVSTNTIISDTEYSTTSGFQWMYFKDIQNAQGITTVVSSRRVGNVYSIDTGAPSGAQTAVLIRKTSPSGAILGTGVVAYQIIYNEAHAPIGGYVTFTIDDKLLFSQNIANLTGDQPIYLDYPKKNLYNISTTIGVYSNAGNCPSGGAVFYDPAGGLITDKYLTVNYDQSTFAEYTLEFPKGIGISGWINKTVGGTTYPSRAYVFNASTNAVIMNDADTTTTDVYVNVISQPIKIAIKSGLGVWYNSSSLFSGGAPTPTPTPTPTVTTTPGQNSGLYSNITLTFRDNSNSAAISGAYIEIWSTDGLTSHQGYTDSNGVFESNLNRAGQHVVKAWKNGYAFTSETIQASQYSYAKTIYMQPDISVVDSINITITVRDSNGWSVNLPGVQVTVADMFGAIATRTGLTDANGQVVFYGVPKTAYLGGTLSKYGYITRNWDMGGMPTGDYWNTLYMASSAGVTNQPTPVPLTPTPTPAPYDTWTLTANPTNINFGDTSLLLAQCSNTAKQDATGGLNVVLYYEKANVINAQNELIGVYRYNASRVDWDFRVNNSALWNYSSHDPRVLLVKPSVVAQYEYTVATFSNTSVAWGTAIASVNVAGAGTQGSLTMLIQANDGQTSNHLSNWNMDISDDLTNTHHIYTVGYDRSLSLARGQSYTIIATKENYQTATDTFTVPIDLNIQPGDFGAIETIPMFLIGSTSAGNCTVTVRVNDAETYYPLGNVVIGLTGQTQKMTGTDGESASFTVPQNTLFTVSASKTGYCTVTETKNTSANTYLYVPIFLKYGSCSGGVIPSHTPIPNSTPTLPTITPIGGYGQINGTAAVCNHLPVNATLLDQVRNQMACNGLKDLLAQNLAMATLIILLCGMIAASKAKAVGFAIGSVIGATMAMALGLIPFWLVAILIILSVLVVVLLVARSR
jgi:hypothetical protein